MLMLGAGMSSVAWGQSVNNRNGDINNPQLDSAASQELRTGSARLVQADWHWWDRDDDRKRHSDRWYREHGYYNNGYYGNDGYYRTSPYYGNNGWYDGYRGDGDHDRDDRWRRNDHDRDDRWRRNDHDRDDRRRHNDHDRDDYRHHDRDRDRD
jgi:hypothetical protein